jgi:hypothetical protein
MISRTSAAKPSVPLRKSWGFVATMTRNAPVGPNTWLPSRANDRAHHRGFRAAPDKHARPRDIQFYRMWARRCRRTWRVWHADARCIRRRFDDDRDKAFRAFLGLAPRLSPLREELLRRRSVPASHLRDNRARLQGRFNRSRFIAGRPAPTAATPARNHLNTALRRGVRVKRMVKSRHKPISKSGDHNPKTGVRPKGEVGTSLTL